MEFDISMNVDSENELEVNECGQKKVQTEESLRTNSELEGDWLFHISSGVKLSYSDKAAIVNNNRLNDKHINFAQGLLKSQFSSIEGLQCTLYQSRLKLDCTRPLVQIVHTHGDHWVVISNIGVNY